MLNIDRLKRSAVAILSPLALASCTPTDPAPPWDTDEMVRQLTSELRRFEGLPSEFSESVILAWRIDTRPGVSSLPRIPLPGGSGVVPLNDDRLEMALLWGRMGPGSAPTGWALVQGHRRPDAQTPWQRALISRELSAPLIVLRPGEDADGTWRGYQRYDRPPTSRDGCDFAAVAFLEDLPGWHRTAGAFRNRAWTRAVGEAPRCGFTDTDEGDRR